MAGAGLLPILSVSVLDQSTGLLLLLPCLGGRWGAGGCTALRAGGLGSLPRGDQAAGLKGCCCGGEGWFWGEVDEGWFWREEPGSGRGEGEEEELLCL